MATAKVIGGADPARANKFLVELFKPWHVVLVIVVFVSILVLSLFVTLFAPAAWYESLKKHNLTGQSLIDVYQNNATIFHETDRLWGLNQDFFVYFTIDYKRFVDRSLSKNDLLVGVDMHYREDTAEPWMPLNSGALTRQLTCSQYAQTCNSIPIAREPNIRHNYYRIGIRIYNAGALFDEGYIGDVHSMIIMTRRAASIFECFWRAVCSVANYAALVYYIVMLIITRTNIIKAPVEQQMTLFLLFGLILFNNPLFILDIVMNWLFIFPLLNQLFISTFVSIFLYYVLVLLHATILQKPGRRSFFGFYLLKIILVFCMWVLNIITRSWIQIAGLYEPTQFIWAGDSGVLSSSLLGAAGWISLLLLAVYAFWVLYMIFRAFGKASRRQLSQLDIRFKFIWFITLITLFSTVGFGVFLFVAGNNNAMMMVFYWTLFNSYVVFCSIMYSPTKAKYSPWEVQEHVEQATSSNTQENPQHAAADASAQPAESEMPMTGFLDPSEPVDIEEQTRRLSEDDTSMHRID